MKTSILVLLLLCFFSSMGLAQLTPKEKSKPEEKITTTQVDTISPAILTELPRNQSSLTPKIKQVKLKETATSLSDPRYVSTTEEEGNTKFNYASPISQVEIYLGYVRYQDHLMDGSGCNGQLTIRQSSEIKNSRKKAWGIGAKFGVYNTKSREFERDTLIFNSKTRELGAFLSYAVATSRPSWNSFVFNFGFKQAIDEGGIRDYRRKQIDYFLDVSGYIDLTRKKDNIFFSRSNLSWYWQWPLRPPSVESFNNGVRVEDHPWNKKMFILNFDQTMLQFNINQAVEYVAFNMGFNVGYQHYSQNKKDMYAMGLFTEWYYSYCKIARVGAEVVIDPSSSTSKGKRVNFKVDLDLFQVGKMVL